MSKCQICQADFPKAELIPQHDWTEYWGYTPKPCPGFNLRPLEASGEALKGWLAGKETLLANYGPDPRITVMRQVEALRSEINCIQRILKQYGHA